MRIYLVKRILFFLPALFCIVLLSFILLHYSPGDPAERILNGSGTDNDINSNAYTKELLEIRHKLGLDLPLFYFSIESLAGNETNVSGWINYVPSISFHSSNQFQRWLFGGENDSKGILAGDFGHSWVTGQPIGEMLLPKMKWSLLLTLFSVFLAFIISIPAGIKSAANPGSTWDRSLNTLFNILFSLPPFWIATLLMLLFCNPDVLNILPSSGVSPAGGFPKQSSFGYILVHSLPYLILPTICYTYSSFAFISGSIRASITGILKEDYIRTARAKGLDERTVLWKHAFRNALLPLITIFSHVFPFVIGGSVILESIFSIPGMGLAIYQAVSSQDYPVIISVFLLTGIITMLGFLLSDLLYALADPRIAFTKTEKA